MNVKLFRRFADEVLKGFNDNVDLPLKRKELQLLSLLGFDEKKSLHFYARQVGLEKGSFTYLVDIMEEKGFVIRQEDAFDRRRKMLLLTNKGKKMAQEINALEEQYFDDFFSRISREDYEVLKQAERVIDKFLRDTVKKEN